MSKGILKLIASFVIVPALFIFLFSISFAQEQSSPNSSIDVKTYFDSNGNNFPDEGEEVSVSVQYAHVPDYACPLVEEDMPMSAVVTTTTPFNVGISRISCIFFMLSSRGGLVSHTRYDARGTTTTSNDVKTIWIKRGCKCRINLPLVIRAWSGQSIFDINITQEKLKLWRGKLIKVKYWPK